jgi:hypothetical protein
VLPLQGDCEGPRYLDDRCSVYKKAAAPGNAPDYAAQLNAAVGDVTLTIGAGTFAWSQLVECTGSKTITINGAGKDLTILDAEGMDAADLIGKTEATTASTAHSVSRTDAGHGFFWVKGTCTLKLNDLTLTRGRDGSGGAIQQHYADRYSKIEATNVKFLDNISGGYGGAVSTSGFADFTNCEFVNNRAGRTGGGVCSSYTTQYDAGTYDFGKTNYYGNNVWSGNTGGGPHGNTWATATCSSQCDRCA